PAATRALLRVSAAPLPPAFRTRVRGLLGPEAEELLDALETPRDPAVRLNPLRGELADLAALLRWPAAPVPWCPAGRSVAAASAAVAAHPLNDAGAYYQQDPAAMAPGEALAPRPGELVVDLAAAPGGKATHLAGLAGDAALVVANDVDERRARTLLGNVERLGVTGAAVTSARPEWLAAALGSAADAVLLDAPCSGEGMFRRSAAAREAWSEAGVARNAELQRRLIAAAADLVRPGGRLGYSTCPFAPRAAGRRGRGPVGPARGGAVGAAPGAGGRPLRRAAAPGRRRGGPPGRPGRDAPPRPRLRQRRPRPRRGR